MRRVFLGLIFATLFGGAAEAACPGTSLTFKDAASATQTLCFGGASGAYIPQYQILDSGGSNILGVNSSGQITIANATFGATQSGVWTVQPGNTPNTTPWLVTPTPSTTGGISGYHLAGGSAASTNATNVKNAAGEIDYIVAQNPTTSIAYLRTYNTAAAPTCSSATNVMHDYAIGAANATGQPNGFVLPIPFGEAYGTGISFCLTGAIGDTDTTNAPVGVSVDIGYK